MIGRRLVLEECETGDLRIEPWHPEEVRGLALVVLPILGCDLVFELDPPADEDGDGIPDARDKCPTEPDASDPDRDGDLVGDACDPDPDVACEQRLLFDGFNLLDPGLVLTDDWFVDAGTLVQPDVSSTTAVAHYPRTMMFDDLRLRAAVTITGFDPTANLSAFQIGSGTEFAGAQFDRGYACTLNRNGDQISTQLIDVDTGAVIEDNPFSGDHAELVFQFDNRPGGNVLCSLVGPAGQGSAERTAVNNMSSGEVFIFSNDAAARVHWFEVIGRICP